METSDILLLRLHQKITEKEFYYASCNWNSILFEKKSNFFEFNAKEDWKCLKRFFASENSKNHKDFDAWCLWLAVSLSDENNKAKL
jgi:hypothetical protein